MMSNDSTASGTIPKTKWSDDAFLERLRRSPDSLANECVTTLREQGVGTKEIMKIFRSMQLNGAPPPPETPDVLRDFLDTTGKIPPDADLSPQEQLDRLAQGQTAFMTHMLPSAMALLFKSIPEGYAAPPLTEVLNISGMLRDNPYHRIMGTLRFLIDVSSPGGFNPGEGHRGILTTQKVRLMHAGVRMNVAPQWDGYEEYKKKYVGPISTEDMLGTMMGFSLLVVHGLRSLHVQMGSGQRDMDGHTDDEEAFYYVWRIFARMFGVYPDGQPDSNEFIPQNLAEATECYDGYCRRHYVGAEDFSRGWRERSEAANAGGVALADGHVNMGGVIVLHMFPKALRPVIPGPLVRMVPRIYMHHLIGSAGCARIGVRPVFLMVIMKFVLINGPRVWAAAWNMVSPKTHVRMSEWLLEKLIRMVYNKELGFIIPSDVKDLRNLVETGWKQ